MSDPITYDSKSVVDNCLGDGFKLKGVAPRPRVQYQKEEFEFAGKTVQSTPGVLTSDFINKNNLTVTSQVVLGDGTLLQFDPKNMPIVQVEDKSFNIPPCLIRSTAELESFLLTTDKARIYARINTPNGPQMIPFDVVNKTGQSAVAGDVPIVNIPQEKLYVNMLKSEKVQMIIDTFSGSLNSAKDNASNPFTNLFDKAGKIFGDDPVRLAENQARKDLKTPDFSFSIGDEIQEINGMIIKTSEDIRKALSSVAESKTPIKIKVKRNLSGKIENVLID